MLSADDVKKTLDMAVTKTGGTKVHVRHRPRLLSDNGPCYLSHERKDYLDKRGITHYPWSTLSPTDAGKDRTVPSINQERHQFTELLYTGSIGKKDCGLRGIV